MRSWFAPGMLVASLIGVLVITTPATPSFAEVRARYKPSEGLLLDREGRPVHELRVDSRQRRAAWVHLSEISPALTSIAIRVEDHRFWDHAGVDWLALASSAGRWLGGHPARGASTITMQVAATLVPRLAAPGRRGFADKWRQIRAALALEQHWTKVEILETYLNQASYRGEIAGVGAASRALLHKAPNGLDNADAVLLVTLLRAPNATPDAVAARGCALLVRLALNPNCVTFTARSNAALINPPMLGAGVALAPQVARQLIRHELREVGSSLDLGIQTVALRALRRQLAELRARSVRDGAVLVLDNASGEVLAYVGNGEPFASARYVDGVRARRQAGSTLKPFLYELALERRLLTAASVLDDSPVNLQTPTGLYVPQNYDHEFKGLVSARTSLSGSLNIPAVRTLMLVGTDAFAARLRTLGFAGINEDGDYYGYSLALGSAEVSLWELVNAYRGLATGDLQPSAPSFTSNEPATTKPLNVDARAASFIVGDILADRGARSITFGLESPLATPFWSAVKTGTSKHMRDNWCVGFSARYTVGVWVGNFDGAPMWDVSGLSGAAPVWAEVMRALHATRGSDEPSPPRDIEARDIVFDGALEPPRTEWFIAGTESTRIAVPSALARKPRIVYPGRDSILVVDPDIPPLNQRVWFAMRPPRAALEWRLNGKTLGAKPSLAWAPQPGTYTLALMDHAAKLDEVKFQVRGGARKP